MRRLLAAALLTGILDGLFSSVLVTFFYGSNVTRLFTGVASVPLGKAATAPLGILIHFGVAFFWSAVFLLLVRRSAWLRRVIASPAGVIEVAAIYGPLIWMVMSLAVIPLVAHRPPSITPRWWIQFFGHMVFVGLPIVGVIRDGKV